MESQRAFCFFIGNDIEHMKNSTCTINSILKSFINSDRLVDSSEAVLTKDELQENEHHLFAYLESKSSCVYEWIQYIFNAIIKYYKEVPEELKKRIQFLIHKYATFRNYKVPLEEAFNNASDKELYIINSQDVFGSIERENLILLNIEYIMDTSIDMWRHIKYFFENTEEDIFVQITSVYIHDPLPIYQLMMMSYNGYICTDVCLYQDAGHQVYYNMLDNYIQNNSKHCYLPLYDLIFTPQDSIVKIRKNISRLMITEAKRVAFYDETNTYAVRFVPTVLHFQKLNPSDVNNSVYAKKPTVNKIKNTLECLIMRLKFLLTVVNKRPEYYDNIKSVLSIYSSIDKHNKESIFNAWTSLHDMPYNMFETYLDKSGRMFQASKLLQDLYDEA